ncbi:NUDIX domain-containing protein [Legionella parisiensis]|uniref:8-oxo-dGTP diphosphatase n=1 Tax=Legionella parisiensis TaxID=45071 RepID=A0A1E5JTF9_9GAMM|nr:NUDIX domain-containing protein [Legionella parisiensis]KTD40410.1 MutT/nudix family protein [Legionella parisiensis]OEH47819.1 8-oxo-dGTP diphosphatase [Legionella parisiensis]STX77156.1 MutT/nudix family protein [Legionella parisiensis]
MNLRYFFYKNGTRCIRKLQSLLGLKTLGSRAIILNHNHQILLVKHTYQPHWYLPGGGVKKGESAKEAIIRELKEEVGIIPTEEPQLFGIYFHTYMGVNDYPVIFIIKNFTSREAYSHEIEQMAWYDYTDLPDMVSPGTKRRLDEYFTQNAKSDRW